MNIVYGERAYENAGRWKYEKLPGAQWLQTWNTSFKVTHVQSGHTLSLELGRILSGLVLAPHISLMSFLVTLHAFCFSTWIQMYTTLGVL